MDFFWDTVYMYTILMRRDYNVLLWTNVNDLQTCFQQSDHLQCNKVGGLRIKKTFLSIMYRQFYTHPIPHPSSYLHGLSYYPFTPLLVPSLRL